MNKPIDIVFMGTPDFAVPALKKLGGSGRSVSLVVTQPDRPKGRGRKVQPPPVKKAALTLGYDVSQPGSMQEPAFLDRLAGIRPDIIVVIAYGRILPKSLLDLPRFGCINIHGSLLPRYRGPAPIQWAVINGETETGVTAMQMNEGLDTGDILLTAKTPILPDDTAGTLHDRLAEMGATLLLETIDRIETGRIRPVPQDPDLATYAPLLRKTDGHIDWSRDAEAIDHLVRGMDPWPGTFTFLEDKRLKIFKVRTVPNDPSDSGAAPGTVIRSFPGELRVAAGSGVISVLELQGASGKRLTVQDFLRGCPIRPGTILT